MHMSQWMGSIRKVKEAVGVECKVGEGRVER
jgi:hypothetical protein